LRAGYFLGKFYLNYALKKSLGNLLLVPAVDILLFILLVTFSSLSVS